MAYRPGSDTAMGRGGAAAITLALVVLALAWGQLLSWGGPPLVALLGLWAFGIGTVILLCRVRMPVPLRAALIVVLVGTMLFAAALGRLFGVERVGAAIDQAADAAGRAGLDNVSRGGSISPGTDAAGAHVALAPAPAGDAGWAAALDDALDRRLGGPAASGLTISGDVSATRSGDGVRVAVAWSIGSGARAAGCGTTRVVGRGVGDDHTALVDQIRQSIDGAVTRSIALGRPACP